MSLENQNIESMNLFMNLLWLLLGGIFTAVEYLISSLLMMITIIGIPFGLQTLKYIDEYSLDIFGRYMDKPFASCLWHLAEYYDYRIAFWHTAFQTGRIGTDPIWKRDRG